MESTSPEVPDGAEGRAPQEHRPNGLEVAIAVLLAVVAVTAALAAWRTSYVGSNAADLNRAGLIAVSKQQSLHHLVEGETYGDADYAAQAAMKEAEAKSLVDSGVPVLAAAGTTILDGLVPSMKQLGGPFAKGQFLSPAGTFDVGARISALETSNPANRQIVPESSFTLANDYSNEKRWLTVLSVLLAIALFWLGLAEISSGRWRIVNLATGVGLWVTCLALFLAIEAWFITSRGGVI